MPSHHNSLIVLSPNELFSIPRILIVVFVVVFFMFKMYIIYGQTPRESMQMQPHAARVDLLVVHERFALSHVPFQMLV